MTYQLGIDVSHYQNPDMLDYEKLKQEGYTWVIARAAYGETPDETFIKHCEKAKAAGLLVGGYLFYRQTKDKETQYRVFSDMLLQVDLDILPCVDLEWNTQYDGNVQPDIFNEDARWIMERLSVEYGQPCIAYTSGGFFETLGKPSWLLEYPWWVAHYTTKAEPYCPYKDWDMWQYTGTGNVSAYSGSLDLNRAKRLALIEKEPEPEPVPEPEPEPVPAPNVEAESACLMRIAELHKGLSEEFQKLARLRNGKENVAAPLIWKTLKRGEVSKSFYGYKESDFDILYKRGWQGSQT